MIIFYKYSALVAVTIGGGVGCLEPERLMLDILVCVCSWGGVGLMGECVTLSCVCVASRSITLRVPAHQRLRTAKTLLDQH
jgi:hypothetical protein